MKNDLNSKPDIRLIISVIIIIAIFVAGSFLFAYNKQKNADMYIVPNDFKGKASVYFNQPAGTPEKVDGEKRIFEIPASGTLYTQSPYKDKWNSYYQATPDGKLEQLIDGNSRTGNGGFAYKDLCNSWIENADFIHSDTNGQKVHIAIFVVGRK
jgi:hypothetical protein